jgi:ProP effector
MSKPKITPEVSALLKRLIREYPAAFRPESQEPVPLANGIHWHILNVVYPDVPPLVVRDALRIYCDRPAYKAALKPGATRVNLKGEPAGTVEAQRPPQVDEPPVAEPKRKKASQSAGAKKMM